MEKKICTVDGCERKSYSKGYCVKHFRRFQKYGNTYTVKSVYDHPDTCKIEGCNNKYFLKGYCRAHYAKNRKYGDPLHSTRELHGMSYSPEYKSWENMKIRCYNKKHESYPSYGGRGITVCDRWKNSFIAFYEDMGEKPSPEYHIDREKGNKNYEPDNCRWLSPKDNCRNRSVVKLSMEKAKEIRIKYHNKNRSIADLARDYNISYAGIKAVILNQVWI